MSSTVARDESAQKISEPPSTTSERVVLPDGVPPRRRAGVGAPSRRYPDLVTKSEFRKKYSGAMILCAT